MGLGKELREALELSFGKGVDSKRASSMAITEKAAYVGGLMLSGSRLSTVTPEQGVLLLASQARDYGVKQIFSMRNIGEEEVLLPATLQVLVDYCRRVNRGIGYHVMNLDGSSILSVDDVRELSRPYYDPKPVEVGLQDMSYDEPLTDDLAQMARHARSFGFPAERGSMRYGCAVKGDSGRIYLAGQYSAFHGFGTIHSEVAAVYAAKMHDDVVREVALSSDRFSDTCAEMCGNCRQCLVEIRELDGVDPVIILTALNGDQRKTSLDSYLPASWSNAERQ